MIDDFCDVTAKQQTPEICLEAVKQNGLVLRSVHYQTEEIILASLNNGVWNVTLIDWTQVSNTFKTFLVLKYDLTSFEI